MMPSKNLFLGFFTAAVLAFFAAAVPAATVALNPRIDLRPLTPSEIKDYGLTNVQGASGLANVGVGQPAYLDAQVNVAFALTNIFSIAWQITNRPADSQAVLTLTSSPANSQQVKLISTLPVYEPSDRLLYQVLNRVILVPDIAGQYYVVATIVATVGTNQVTNNISQVVTAGKYMGVNTCALCHSGGIVASNIVATYTNTIHATAMSAAIDGRLGASFSARCLSCHNLGFDTNALAANGGFDDIAAQVGWTFPATLTNGNWAAMPAKLKNVANVQCENCHGAGSEHAFALGDTAKISRTFDSGACAQCHDSKPKHNIAAEWNNSVHALNTRTPSGWGRAACARCHTGGGFAGYAYALNNSIAYTTNGVDTNYTAITCAVCHDPHDATYDAQLRLPSAITLGDGSVITNAGLGGFCMNCHQSRNGSVTNSVVQYALGQQTWAGGSAFGVHDSPVGDMLEGVNGWTYGLTLPSSPHRAVISNTCLTCHMQATATNSPAYLKAGGHSFNMNYPVVSGGITNTVDMVGACVQCHGQIDSFDFPVADYDGDGVINGVQTEVQNLLNKLSTMLPGTNNVANGNYVADGLVKTSVSPRTNWPAKYLKAAYNWQFVNNDHSLGVHNAAYAVGLLKASIGDLTGDANNDGLPDAWQIQYFGSVSNPQAAPNYSAAGDGIPNWLKYALGMDPTVSGITISNGVVWANGNTIINPSKTNSIAIYTAAEIAFNTVVGKTYQIQAISAVDQSWANVGSPITGTGNTISFVVPTRQNLKQFYRVVTQ